MTTPLTTIADALIEFILSLLGDPAAAEEFENDPDGTLARNGLSNVCAEDVQAVKPIIVDRPDVHPKPPAPPGPPGPPSVEKEIFNITNTFSIDQRATIVDQSVNQNIWAQGDVNQIFDQEAIVNSGDNGAAAGDDASVDNSDTDVTVGDVAIGNEETNTNIDGSFNDSSTDTETTTETDTDDSYNDSSTDVAVDTGVSDSFNDTTEVVTTSEESFDFVESPEPQEELSVEENY